MKEESEGESGMGLGEGSRGRGSEAEARGHGGPGALGPRGPGARGLCLVSWGKDVCISRSGVSYETELYLQ